ncbi:MAG: ribonucleotide-diphosphate reductase subunit beta [Enterococcus sp.]
MSYLYFKAVNWNETQDTLDQYTWEKLTNNFWLDTRIPIEEDLPFWKTLTSEQRTTISHLLATVGLNASLQAETGAASLRSSIQTQQEEAVLNITTFMESVHTKALTTIFRQLNTKTETQSYYDFANQQTAQIEQLERCQEIMQNGSDLQKKAAFLLVETVLLYGKLTPVLLNEPLVQTRQMLTNLLKGSSIFNSYLGYKFQQAFTQLALDEQQLFKTWLDDLIAELFASEVAWLTKQLTPEQQNISEQLVAYAANYTLTTFGFAANHTVQLPNQLTSYLETTLMTVKELQKQETTIYTSQLETMATDDYDF